MTAGGAVVVTACDAVLLQQSKNYFTGGFLSVDHLERPLDIALFLGSSLVVDAAFIGLTTALVAWLLRSRLRPPARVFAGALAGTSLLVVADIISYGVLRYLGDVFDFELMFDLTGRSVAEILAVSSSHLVVPVLLIVAAAAVLTSVVWAANRYWVKTPPATFPARVLIAPVLFAICGAVVLTAASNGSDILENGLLRKPAGRALAFVVTRATDVDRDGFGAIGRNADPAPFDPAIFPYAPDVPGNGIDENGVGGDLPLAHAAYDEPSYATVVWKRRPDVVLVVLESFRADLVGAREGGVAVTPVIDALSAGGVAVARAFSHNGYTVQSRHHLFTGSLLAVPTDSTIIDDFLRNGYRVGYFSGQDESFGGAKYDVGFTRATMAVDARADRARRYSTATTPGSLAVPAPVVQERVGEFLQQHGAADAPLFLYVNFHDTHFPYSRPGLETLTSGERLPRARIAPAARDALWRTYANTAANVDRAIGELIDAVRRARGSEPGIVITADHGESLFDEGFLGHGYALNDVQTRIPLVVANLPLVLPEPFGQVDLRRAINSAFEQPGPLTGVPHVELAPDREIFQYLGDLSRPRQIAFLLKAGRLIYDFRTARVQVPGDQWRLPSELSGVSRDMFLRLVWQWEAMSLARLAHVESEPAASRN
ncbi:MAG TPA: sulfatase-like hydrolase/transferase [Vicinamibacterales bacterium]|nr:sulfatase-like hydrolase/transferase [Vicinamibacterales bacterium]